MGAGQLLYLGNHDDLVQGARSGTGEKRWQKRDFGRLGVLEVILILQAPLTV